MTQRFASATRVLLLVSAWSMTAVAVAGSGYDYSVQDGWQPVSDMQSPIAIESKHVVKAADADPDTRLVLRHRVSEATVLNSDHALQANIAPGTKVMLRGRRFELLQMHFHSPAEHTVDGQRAPVEAHLVYRGSNGRLAVVGVQYRSGAANAELAKLIAAHAKRDSAPLKLKIDSLLPSSDGYYHYLGSLTTPPLSQNVEWYVLAKSLSASPEQIAALERIHNGNNRHTQPLNGRPVLHVTPR